MSKVGFWYSHIQGSRLAACMGWTSWQPIMVSYLTQGIGSSLPGAVISHYCITCSCLLVVCAWSHAYIEACWIMLWTWPGTQCMLLESSLQAWYQEHAIQKLCPALLRCIEGPIFLLCIYKGENLPEFHSTMHAWSKGHGITNIINVYIQVYQNSIIWKLGTPATHVSLTDYYFSIAIYTMAMYIATRNLPKSWA